MYQYFQHHKIILAFAIISLGLLITSLILRPLNPLPKVILSTPVARETRVDFSKPVSFVFDREIDPSQISLTSTPEESWEQIATTTNKGVSFAAKRLLHTNTEYTLNLSYSGKIIYTLTFATIEQQSDPRYVQEVNDEIERDYPLATKTPLDQPGYSVVYSAPLTLEITLKNDSAGRDEVINAVRDWVKQNGLDPASHTYTFAN